MNLTASMIQALPRSPFEGQAREIIEEYSLEPTDECVADLAMRLAQRQYEREMAPYFRQLARLVTQQTPRLVYEPATQRVLYQPEPLPSDLAVALQALARSVAKELGIPEALCGTDK